MAEKNNPLSYFKHLAYNSTYELLKRHTLNQKLERFPNHFLKPDYENGTYESITADIDPVTNKVIEITGRYDFKKDFEKKLSLRSTEAKKEIESMLMDVLVGGGNTKAVGSILLDELNQVLSVADSKYSESLKFKETVQNLITFVCEKFKIKLNQAKNIIEIERFDSIFEPKDFVSKTTLQGIYDIAIDEDLIDDVEITFDMFFNTLTKKKTSKGDYIKFSCFNNKMRSFIVSISSFFNNLKARSIEDSKVFYTKKGTALKVSYYDKIDEKEGYTKKLTELLKPYLK